MLDPKVENIFEFYRIIESYKGSESEALFLLLHSNLFFKSILIKNFHDLNTIVSEHNSSAIYNLIWRNKDSRFRSSIQQKIARLMFNYLSAVFGYVDFARVHNNSYLKKNHQVFDFIKANNPFKEHLAHRFIQDLRNFAIHNKPIPIGSELVMKIEWDTPRRNIYVEKSNLLKWSSWSVLASKFIEKQDEKIYLFDILKAHFEEFIKYQVKIFRLLLKVSPSKTAEFKKDIETIYAQANLINKTGALPFNSAFVRYINYQIVKSQTERIT
ncbi:hypothetical protein OCK74_13460 [Chitinophagaceae bacterium LB-8]|uniref:Uncharacterized protein n=1 Tax=Paraflavisolibacter caeni TaxID=2982496 RepID=A0A9X2XW31_9BACT|nr:hypothetical protein [Paraflavisolibacter caeni]MCU7550125.1 hypothetical protein [Paraflavisolibacter caeni]